MLPGLEFLIEHLEQARLDYTGNLYMRERVKRAWEKLDKYYGISDKLIAYIGATVLNPLFKWQWFDARWTTPNLAPALIQGRASVQQLWQSNYAEAYTNRPITPQHNGVGGEDGEVNDFAAFLF